MYTTSDFKRGLRIEIDGQPYSIIEFEHHKPGKGASIVRTKLRNLVTGQVVSPTFRSGDKVGRPDVEDKDGQFLFSSGETFTFMDPQSYEQYEIHGDMLGDQAKFLVDGMHVSILFYQGKAVSVELPNSVVLQIVETEPAVKGDTATNATKKAKLSTGHFVHVPLFMKEGEMVKVDTRSGEYIERA
ncbi:MAG: elongation factor P [Deltaproteobacteria bacterium]|nr:elongation factor P [Deltaproteobacteria bacterium]